MGSAVVKHEARTNIERVILEEIEVAIRCGVRHGDNAMLRSIDRIRDAAGMAADERVTERLLCRPKGENHE
jgi:hypothetical protein